MTVCERRIAWDWIDDISLIDEGGRRIVAHRLVRRAEWYFDHHFECCPVVPGVFLVEMMTRAAALLQILRVWASDRDWAHYVLAGTDGTRFYRSVEPESHIALVASVRQGDDEQIIYRAQAEVDGTRVARTDVMLQRIRSEWLKNGQDQVIERTLRRVLSPELKARFDLE